MEAAAEINAEAQSIEKTGATRDERMSKGLPSNGLIGFTYPLRPRRYVRLVGL